jgi:hypothetical protein
MLRYRRHALGRMLEGNHQMQHENLTEKSPPPEATLALRAGTDCPPAARSEAPKKRRVRLFKV